MFRGTTVLKVLDRLSYAADSLRHLTPALVEEAIECLRNLQVDATGWEGVSAEITFGHDVAALHGDAHDRRRCPNRWNRHEVVSCHDCNDWSPETEEPSDVAAQECTGTGKLEQRELGTTSTFLPLQCDAARELLVGHFAFATEEVVDNAPSESEPTFLICAADGAGLLPAVGNASVLETWSLG